MAVTVFGRAGRIDTRPDGALARLVAGATAKVSATLGYTEHSARQRPV